MVNTQYYSFNYKYNRNWKTCDKGTHSEDSALDRGKVPNGKEITVFVKQMFS